MAIDSSQIIPLPDVQPLESFSGPDDAMINDPHAVIQYILSVRDNRQKVNDAHEKIVQIRERQRAIKQDKKNQRLKAEIERDILPTNWHALSPIAAAVMVSIMSLVLFTNIIDGVPPWSPGFELMRHKFFDIKWHWVIPFGMMLLVYVVGFAKGYLSTMIAQRDMETCNSRFGIKKRMEQYPLPIVRHPKDQEGNERLYVDRVGRFSDYVGNLHSGSQYSRNFSLGFSCTLLLNALVLCCALISSYAQDDEKKNACVGIWAKAVVLLLVLAVSFAMWECGVQYGWNFAMGSLAKHLRKECLGRKQLLDRCKESGRECLEALVTEILHEETWGEEEKSAEVLEYEKAFADSVVSRVRC